ncbi:hypothetical protein BU16DRAFT_461731 [Lophium mytilinum]|uniref:Thioredoxin domain-containing protein n=1 Tax=Lophium mytilinum TaxID=390894 RepID=A0A6A6QU46_9PEZI|nr:hypothetical protein BU16DRAFT_461731 [Lophium mytilinum]
MTIQQELNSLWAPTKVETGPVPALGQQAPSTERLPILSFGGKPTVVTFLRHCGCPFAEKTFISLRKTAEDHPDMRFIAVSHSDRESTDKWLRAVGGADQVSVIVDSDRELFGRWGLGVSGYWHMMHPASMWTAVRLGREENIWNRPTESGSRWQTSGSFAVDGEGKVKWGGAAPRADYIPSFEEAVESVSK